MIDMQVGQHDALDVSRANAQRLEPRAGFLLRLDVEANTEAEIGMPAWQDASTPADAPVSTRITPSRCSMA